MILCVVFDATEMQSVINKQYGFIITWKRKHQNEIIKPKEKKSTQNNNNKTHHHSHTPPTPLFTHKHPPFHTHTITQPLTFSILVKMEKSSFISRRSMTLIFGTTSIFSITWTTAPHARESSADTWLQPAVMRMLGWRLPMLMRPERRGDCKGMEEIEK